MSREVTILRDLRDLGGVTGSFVLSSQGQPMLRDVPQLLTDDTLSEVGSRIVRLREAFSEEAPGDDCVLRFEQHRLTIRQAGEWILCVLSDDSANLATLQMGLTLATRKLATMTLDEASSAAAQPSPAPSTPPPRSQATAQASPAPATPQPQVPAPPSPAPSTLQSQTPAPPTSKSSKLIYRGQRVR